MIIGMDIKGIKELEAMLTRLEKKDAAKIVRTETRDAQKVVMLPEVKSNAMGMVRGLMGGLIAKNLVVRAMSKMKRGSYGAKIIIKDSDAFVHVSATGQRSYIPNAIEYGHAAANDAKGEKVAKPIPFKRNAYETKQRALRTHFSSKVIKAIFRAAKFK